MPRRSVGGELLSDDEKSDDEIKQDPNQKKLIYAEFIKTTKKFKNEVKKLIVLNNYL